MSAVERPGAGRVRSRVVALVSLTLLGAVLAGLLLAHLPLQHAVAVDAEEEERARAGASGIGDPYFPLDGNGGIDVQHYDVRNSYDFTSRVLTGRTRITVTATQTLSRFNLDLLLTPTEVTVKGRPARFRKEGKHELVITPRQTLRRGSSFVVEVAYRGKPEKLRYRGEQGWFSSEDEVVAVNQPHIAPWWFPANDHPSDKATFAIQVTVPRGKQVIANGRLVSKKRKGEQTVWRWRARDPMATYLAFFAAGDYRIERGTTEGLPWLVAVSERLEPERQRRSMAQLKKSAQYVRWLEKHLGPYPFETTGGISVGFDLGFALENQTRPIYPGFWWQDTSLVIHELAHQWFGDSVALARWRDIWINEGLATFMEHRRLEWRTGVSAQLKVDELWESYPATSAFWKVLPARPGASALFHAAVYDRGGATVQALRTRIGDSDFRRLLKTWTQRYAHGNATSADFEALAAEISGEDLDAFFDVWLRTPARPARTVENGFLQ